MDNSRTFGSLTEVERGATGSVWNIIGGNLCSLASPHPCPASLPRGGWRLRSSHSPWTVPRGNKDVSGVENPYGIGIPGEGLGTGCCSAPECWGQDPCRCQCKDPWVHRWEGWGWCLFPDCSSGSPLWLSSLSPSVPGGVLLLLTEALFWSPRGCFGGGIAFFNLFCCDFLPHWGPGWGEHSEMSSWSHRRPLSCHLGSLEEFWTRALPAACVEDPRASLELMLPQPLHGP